MVYPVLFILHVTGVGSFCLNQGNLITHHKYLDNSLHSIQTDKSLFECAAICSSNSDCFSFGFDAENRSCHLHEENNTADLIGRRDWVHSDIASWPKEILGPCEGISCRSREQCIVNPVTKLPGCAAALIFKQPEICPTPLRVPNAKVGPGHQYEGSVRSYTCNPDYLDTSLDVSEANITCQKNNTWSVVQLNCTGPYVRLDTFDSYKQLQNLVFKQIIKNSTVLFLGKACHDLILSLHTYSNNIRDTSHAYEVVIGGGGNQWSEIRKGSLGVIMNPNTTPEIVSCSEFRPFWLSWDDSFISVGEGKVVGNHRFLHMRMSNPITINYITISSYIKNRADWLFVKRE